MCSCRQSISHPCVCSFSNLPIFPCSSLSILPLFNLPYFHLFPFPPMKRSTRAVLWARCVSWLNLLKSWKATKPGFCSVIFCFDWGVCYIPFFWFRLSYSAVACLERFIFGVTCEWDIKPYQINPSYVLFLLFCFPSLRGVESFFWTWIVSERRKVDATGSAMSFPIAEFAADSCMKHLSFSVFFTYTIMHSVFLAQFYASSRLQQVQQSFKRFLKLRVT